MPRPDGSGDIAVTAVVQQQQNPVDSVTLVYRVGYGPETNVSMTGNGCCSILWIAELRVMIPAYASS